MLSAKSASQLIKIKIKSQKTEGLHHQPQSIPGETDHVPTVFFPNYSHSALALAVTMPQPDPSVDNRIVSTTNPGLVAPKYVRLQLVVFDY